MSDRCGFLKLGNEEGDDCGLVEEDVRVILENILEGVICDEESVSEFLFYYWFIDVDLG